MAKTDDDTIRALINSVSEPVFIIIPDHELEDEQFIKLFQTLEDVLTKIETKVECEFDVMVETADYFGGYAEMSNLFQEEKDTIESEQPGTESDIPF